MSVMSSEEKERPMTVNPCAARPAEYGNLVKGCWYRAMILGSPFDFWVSRKLSRAEAREAAVEFAGREIYERDDIESVRLLKGWGR